MTAYLTFTPPLATLEDIERLERRIEKLEQLIPEPVEDWHGKAKGSS